MKLQNFLNKRSISLSLSVYFTVFTCLSSAAPGSPNKKDEKKSGQSVVAKAASAKSSSSRSSLPNTAKQRRQFTPEEALSIIRANKIRLLSDVEVKNYKNDAKSIGPQAALYPNEVTNSSNTVENIISSRYIGPSAPAGGALGNIIIDPFGSSPINQTLPLPTNSSLPMPSTLPPMPMPLPLPPTGTTFPSGGIGLPNGNGFSITAAPVSNDFTCNFYDNNPFSSMFNSIDNMKNSISSGVTSGCLQGDVGSAVSASVDSLKNSIDFIKYYNSNPEQLGNPNASGSSNLSMLNAHVDSTVKNLNQIATTLSHSSPLRPECGNYSSSFNRMIVNLNQMISGLAPIFLAAMTFAPQISVSVKSALLTTTLISQISTSTWQSFYTNGINIKDPPQRRAVLQDVCQYLKIKQRIDYLTYDTESKINSINTDLQTKINNFKNQFQTAKKSDQTLPNQNVTLPNQNTNETLIPILKYRYNTEKQLAELETGLAQDRMNFKRYNDEIQKYEALKNKVDFASADLSKYKASDVASAINATKFICRRGGDFINRGSIPENFSLNTFGNLFGSYGMNTSLPAFPLSIISNLDRVTEILQQSSSNGFPFGGGFGTGLPVFPQVPTPDLPGLPAPTPPPAPADPNTQSANDPFQPPPAVVTNPGNNQTDSVSNMAENLFNDFKNARNKVSASYKLVKEDDTRAYLACADNTILWMNTMEMLIAFTESLANQSRPALLEALEQDPKYKSWAAEYERLVSDTKAATPMIKVLNMMLKERPAYLLTEANISLNELKNSLFQKPLVFGNSAVGGWLQFHINTHDEIIGKLSKQVSDLQKQAADLTYKHLSTSKDTKTARADVLNTRNLGTITSLTVEEGSKSHNDICGILQTGLHKYVDAVNALETTDFMCNMLSSTMPDLTDHVKNICGANVANNKKSATENRRAYMAHAQWNLGNISINEFVKIMEKKKSELNCNIKFPL